MPSHGMNAKYDLKSSFAQYLMRPFLTASATSRMASLTASGLPPNRSPGSREGQAPLVGGFVQNGECVRLK